MLFHTRSCKSTDPRDKVFSVLGLVDPSVYEVKPDYRISLDQAIKTVTRAIINKKQSLDVMAGSQVCGLDINLLFFLFKLGSWAVLRAVNGRLLCTKVSDPELAFDLRSSPVPYQKSSN